MVGDNRELLAPAEAYRLWAPTYEQETVVSALEARVVGGLIPELGGRRLLDVGCGTARRIRTIRERPAFVVGLDLVPEMLRTADRGGPPTLVAGDARRLPFRDATFDVLWCRLVLGHLAELDESYRELARVACDSAALIVSDFHPLAVAAGHTRSFRDGSGRVHEIEHWVHDVTQHAEAAAHSGWKLVATVDAPAGEEERSFYERARRLSQLDRESALPLVLAMSFAR
jgi:malonyl-CoA O-methyltransferase